MARCEGRKIDRMDSDKKALVEEYLKLLGVQKRNMKFATEKAEKLSVNALRHNINLFRSQRAQLSGVR